MNCPKCGKLLMVGYFSLAFAIEPHNCTPHTHQESKMGDPIGRFQNSVMATTSSGVQPTILSY
jgi:hypothetical protein